MLSGCALPAADFLHRHFARFMMEVLSEPIHMPCPACGESRPMYRTRSGAICSVARALGRSYPTFVPPGVEEKPPARFYKSEFLLVRPGLIIHRGNRILPLPDGMVRYERGGNPAAWLDGILRDRPEPPFVLVEFGQGVCRMQDLRLNVSPRLLCKSGAAPFAVDTAVYDRAVAVLAVDRAAAVKLLKARDVVLDQPGDLKAVADLSTLRAEHPAMAEFVEGLAYRGGVEWKLALRSVDRARKEASADEQ